MTGPRNSATWSNPGIGSGVPKKLDMNAWID